MTILFRILIVLLFPVVAIASEGSAMSFAPPVTDVSVSFLGNLFGVVDGVLHGTGSQIMGSMFAVFNSAVLALGGIIIMYTLLVSTMNTAQEGQFLGQKFSSIWVPVRSTVGLALLLPKASGYCMMQIFVMWVIVQGIGAADKVWNGALDYLNRGGVIIQAQIDVAQKIANLNNRALPQGALAILEGQVCMIALQNQLQAQQQVFNAQKQKKTGPCYTSGNNFNNKICSGSVPSFADMTNAVAYQTDNPKPAGQSGNFEMPMPYLKTGDYVFLNGACGVISWKPTKDAATNPELNLSQENQDTIALTRAMAVQQMYQDLLPVAQVMVNNDPALAQTSISSSTAPFQPWASSQFGIPLSAGGTPCTAKGCTSWGPVSASGNTMLLTGTELTNAIADYMAVMLPTLRLKGNLVEGEKVDFISKAEANGWILAGSYFFDLARLNGNAMSQDNPTDDTDSGLDKSKALSDSTIMKAWNGANCEAGSNYAAACNWLNYALPAGSSTFPALLNQLITGSAVDGNGVKNPLADSFPTTPLIDKTSSTVFGYANNALLMQTVQQAGSNQVAFANQMTVEPSTNPMNLPDIDFGCGKVKIVMFSFCLGGLLGDVFYNLLIVPIYNLLNVFLGSLIQSIVMMLLTIPLQAMGTVFTQGIKIISSPGVNPIIAMANMGTMYINYVGQLFTTVLAFVAGLNIFLPFIMPFMAMIAPLVLSWLSVMLAVAFVGAYYVPMLPYIIFTFGALAWFLLVIEAMVAAPIVALGVTHPEGHEAFGKGEQAIMLLISIFLRPGMMIIGFIAGIALSYVGVWMLNAGYDHAVNFIQASGDSATSVSAFKNGSLAHGGRDDPNFNGLASSWGHGADQADWNENYSGGGYTGWAGIFSFLFSVVIYTSMYMVVVQRSFSLIAILPDKVMRWIGGPAETAGAEAMQWAEETKGKVGEAGKEAMSGMGQMAKGVGDKLSKGIESAKDSDSSSVEGSGGGGGGEAAGAGAAAAAPPVPM